jgi:hypothetical protein
MSQNASSNPLHAIQPLEQFPDLAHMAREFDPDNLTAAEVLKVLTMMLAKTRGADGLAKLRAQVVMEEQYARGFRSGRDDGERVGYQRGYLEGLEEGRKEALESAAREEAERAMVRAAASARRQP